MRYWLTHSVDYELEVDKGKLTAVANLEELTFQALALHRSKGLSDEGLTLETSASLNSLRWLIYLYQLQVHNQLSVLLARRRSTKVSLETNHFVLWLTQLPSFNLAHYFNTDSGSFFFWVKRWNTDYISLFSCRMITERYHIPRLIFIFLPRKTTFFLSSQTTCHLHQQMTNWRLKLFCVQQNSHKTVYVVFCVNSPLHSRSKSAGFDPIICTTCDVINWHVTKLLWHATNACICFGNRTNSAKVTQEKPGELLVRNQCKIGLTHWTFFHIHFLASLKG